jgi:hypothetical protein
VNDTLSKEAAWRAALRSRPSGKLMLLFGHNRWKIVTGGLVRTDVTA